MGTKAMGVSAADQAKALIEHTFSELGLSAQSDDKFFPHGIGLIEFEIAIGTGATAQLQVKFKVEGVKPGGQTIEAGFAEAPIDETTCAGIVFAETASLRSTDATELATARRFVAGVAYKRQGSGVAKPQIPTTDELKNPNVKREWELCQKAAKDAAKDDVGTCRHFVIWPLDDKNEGPATKPKIPAAWPYDHKDKIDKKYGPFKNSVHPVGDAIYVIKYCGVP